MFSLLHRFLCNLKKCLLLSGQSVKIRIYFIYRILKQSRYHAKVEITLTTLYSSYLFMNYMNYNFRQIFCFLNIISCSYQDHFKKLWTIFFIMMIMMNSKYDRIYLNKEVCNIYCLLHTKYLLFMNKSCILYICIYIMYFIITIF